MNYFLTWKNFQITEAIDKISASYNCKPVEGMLSYQLEKDIIDGNKRIIQNPSDQQKYISLKEQKQNE